ncbi:hypothetical protein PVAND_009669 [Polypedilum vanderplanki]|uniref:Methyltransferase domain-containing protein n=1 Tax=Polypedilum vanderplanki TaxID=319348 RepID=A0A9J6CE95_POLVA|nr:hypothetical protein PVAND_009669 [Polypedilum vanderplanki]
MDVGEIYHKVNQYQVQNASDCIKKVRALLHDKFGNQKCKLLDIGTGDGRVLSEVFVKHSGLNFEKVLGSDINLEMIKVAKKNYQNDLIKFEQLNIEDEEASSELLKVHGTFDILTTYFCLHWIKDLKIALSNVKRFLKPNGVFHIISFTKCSATEAFIELANNSKYHAYRDGILNFPLHKKLDHGDLDNIINDLGFEVKMTESILPSFDFETDENLKNFFNMAPFIKNMPANMRQEFLIDLAETTRKMNKQQGLLDYSFDSTLLHCLVIKKNDN